jgi:DTW domain-containing protein YfiP
MYVVAEKAIERKLEEKKNHCQRCWFPREMCVCAAVKPIERFTKNVRFKILMHYKGMSNIENM